MGKYLKAECLFAQKTSLTHSMINIVAASRGAEKRSTIVPLANVLFPSAIFIALSNDLGASGFSGVTQILIVLVVFFAVTSIAVTVNAFINKKIIWYAPYLQFKLRESIQHRAMTMDYRWQRTKKQ